MEAKLYKMAQRKVENRRLIVNERYIPEELKNLDQWVAWKYVSENGKEKKVPIDPKTGRRASVTDPETWGSFNQAFKYQKHGMDGIGFVFSQDDQLCGIDLDDCRDPKTKKILPWARRIIKRVNSYTETSPSGKGVKIFAMGSLPSGGRKGKNIEMYDQRKFFTVTGRHHRSTPLQIKRRPDTIKNIYNEFFNAQKKPGRKVARPELRNFSDDEIIEKAMNAKNGPKFKRLLEGNIEGYASHSEADQALVAELAFWTDKDPKRIDTLFRRSGLMREKWNRQDYRDKTISKAIDLVEVGYGERFSFYVAKALAQLDAAKATPQNTVLQIIKDRYILNEMAILFRNDQAKFQEIMMEMRSRGVTIRDVESLRKAVRAITPTSKDSSVKSELETAKNIFPYARVSNEILIPQGYQVSDKGVFKPSEGKIKTVAFSPVLIRSKLKNIVDGSEQLELTWRKNKKWFSRKINREEVADSGRLVKHARYGFPVDSRTAGLMTEYISVFEATNERFLPKELVSNQLGWQGKEGKYGFLLGRHFITNKRQINSIGVSGPPRIHFRGETPGEEQIADGWGQAGTFKEWLRIIPLIENYPSVTCALCASLSTPLVWIFGAPIFTVEWAGKTTTGKTSTLKIAASCWGNPDQSKEKSVMKTWDATPTWMERALNILRHLPLLLDETQISKNPELIRKFLYGLPSGQGRGRGTASGLQKVGLWQTLALISGESKAASLSKAGGAHARVLSIWGIPFKEQSQEVHRLIQNIERIIRDNYGHAGRRLVKYILKNRRKWKHWREQYPQMIKQYEKMAGQNAVALRQAPYLALIHMAAMIAKEALGLPIDYEAHLKGIFEMAMKETPEANKAQEAFLSVLGWASSRKDSFYRPDHRRQPMGGWHGVWNPNGKKDLIAFIPYRLERFLREEGNEPRSIIRIWKEEGLLNTSGEERGLTRKVTLQGERVRMYVLKMNEPAANIEKKKDRPIKRVDRYSKNRRVLR